MSNDERQMMMRTNTCIGDGTEGRGGRDGRELRRPVHDVVVAERPGHGGRVESTGAVGIENGIGTETIKTVVDAPFLHFPGFVKMIGSGPFPDASACTNA